MSASNLGKDFEGQESYEPPAPSIPPGWIAVPRRVVFVQAFLLAAVGVNAFLCGVLFSRGAGKPQTVQSVVVQGRIRNTSNEPLPRCLVMFLPKNAKPQSPLDAMTLRNNELSPSVSDRLRSIGAAWSVTDSSGSYRIELSEPTEYYVLMLSREGARNDPTQQELAAIGQYFVTAFDLVQGRRYAWVVRQFEGDAVFDHRF